MQALVSIVVPVYNCGAYLPPCIESILAQTYPHIQLILVDDGSADGSGEICDRYAAQDARVTVLHQENRGVSAARNAGLEQVTGEYLLFVDSDDSLMPDAIASAMEGFSQADIGLVVFRTRKRMQDGQEEPLPMDAGIFSREEMLRGVLSDFAAMGGGYPWNKVWRLGAFAGDIPRFRKDLYFFEDLEWAVRMLMHVRQANLLPAYGYLYCVRPDSATNKPGTQERRETGYHRSLWRVLQTLEQLPEIRAWFADRYYPQLVNGVIHACKQGWKALRGILAEKLMETAGEILSSKTISFQIKFRCAVLCLLHWLGMV